MSRDIQTVWGSTNTTSCHVLVGVLVSEQQGKGQSYDNGKTDVSLL